METKDSTIKQAWLERRKAIRPKPISELQEDLVRVCNSEPGEMLPLILEPNISGVSLPGWIRNNLEFIEAKLLEHGGILFRGFAGNTQADFEHCLDALAFDLMRYTEGATPRTELGDKVYTSTEYPSAQTIALHNELTYVLTHPAKITFFCVTAPTRGGETPIADVRKVFNRIDRSIRDRFIEKGWMLTRNYGFGMSLPWTTTFHTTDRAEVERYCSGAGISFEWKQNGGLRTRQVRPAIATHPKTGEAVWFNHVVFWHISSLDDDVRRLIESEYKEEDLPYNTYYGDGTPIDDAVINEIREAYRQETVAFPWQEGCLLLLDNILVAHGRSPFEGERRILAAMGEPYTRTDCKPL